LVHSSPPTPIVNRYFQRKTNSNESIVFLERSPTPSTLISVVTRTISTDSLSAVLRTMYRHTVIFSLFSSFEGRIIIFIVSGKSLYFLSSILNIIIYLLLRLLLGIISIIKIYNYYDRHTISEVRR